MSSSSSIIIWRSVRKQLIRKHLTCNSTCRTVSLLQVSPIQQQEDQQNPHPFERAIRRIHITNNTIQNQNQNQYQSIRQQSTKINVKTSYKLHQQLSRLQYSTDRIIEQSLRLLSTTTTPTPPDSTESIESVQVPSSNTSDSDVSINMKKEYSIPELTEDAARHKAGLEDTTCPKWQNPLHHNNDIYNRQFIEDFNGNEEEFKKHIRPVPPIDGDGIPQYIQDIAEELVHLTLLEMNELANKIADHYGFHEGMLSPDDDDNATDGTGGDGSTGDDGDDADTEVVPISTEKTKFDFKLIEYDASVKIKIIKEVRSIAGLGLKEAKDAVESVPKTIMKDISKEQADELKKKFEDLGAKVEII